MSCIFCDISAGDAEASFVYEDDRTIAFLDINPVNAGHTLVVPRAHAASLAALDPEEAARVMRVAQRVACGLRQTNLRCEGVNLWLADGEAAGQDVFHVHMHVVPRFADDGFRIVVDFGNPDRAELDVTAAALRTAL